MIAQLQTEAGVTSPTILQLLPGQPVTVGRHGQNTIVLEDDLASRWHGVLVFDGNRWVFSNIAQPVNGTLINGAPAEQPLALAHDQCIEIGKVRLRFTVESGETVPDGEDSPATPLHSDELTALCNFMAASLAESDTQSLIRLALDIARSQTQAPLAGFLSHDAESAIPRLTSPDDADLDPDLSRQLTQEVQGAGKTICLADLRQDDEIQHSFHDALCVPLPAGATGSSLGAIHVYHVDGVFGDRHRRFCELLAGYLGNSLRILRARRQLEAENLRLRSHSPAAEQIIGSSPGMKQLRKLIALVAPRPSTVLIQGESGVGKELVALALHRQSARRDGPLVVVNCAAIADTLPEAELFGHCKGAFAGADQDRPGLFQQADEGTLFLDEIGDLPLDCQAKLLRVIEGKGFRPIGGVAEINPNVRIIAATNRDLEKQIQEGTFRQDLYFRLVVIHIVVPPLREHLADISALVQYFLDRLSRELRRPLAVSDAGLRRLQEYSWPGNVRQLWAVLESAAVLSDQITLDAGSLRLPIEVPIPGDRAFNLDQLESWAIKQALKKTKGNVTQAARLLGVVRDTLARKMKQKNLRRDQY